MSAIALEVSVIVVLLLLNGVFSMSEMALVSARKSRLEHRAERGDAGARAALDLASHPANFLSTVQVGITLVGVLAGAFGGATLSEVLALRLRDVQGIGEYAEPVAFGLVVSAITYLSLILGELVPKQIALGHPEAIAAFVARPMRALATLGAPLVTVLTGSTKLVFRVFGIRATVAPGVTEQDIRAMVEQGAEAGVIAAVEHEIVENTFRLGDQRVSMIMTPRHDVAWIDVHAQADQIHERVAAARWSPYLVCEGSTDQVVGFLEAEDLVGACLSGGPLALRGVVREPLFVPGSMLVLRLLEEFRSRGRYAAVVLDEFGGFSGIVTVEDILEALVGALPAEGGRTDGRIEPQSDGTWLVEGRVPLPEVLAALEVELPGPEARVDTIGGLVMTGLGRLPVEGDTTTIGPLTLRVERMVRRRVVQLRISRTGMPC